MNKKVIALIASLVIIGAITPIIVIKIRNSEPDPSQFKSEIKRFVFDEYYLHILLSLENISGSCNYFDEIRSNNYEDNVENITHLIEKEEYFLSIYDPKDFTQNKFRYHKFIYHGNLSSGISNSSLINIIHSFPTFLFYYNFSTSLYHSITFYEESTSDPESWNIDGIIQYVFSEESQLLLVNQSVEVADIYAPLAGSGTQFTRFILCKSSSIPIFFISNEGPWWIS